MAQPLRVIHDRDPREVISEQVGDILNEIAPLGAGVLLVMYKRPNKTASGIFLSDKTVDEDKYQGKVGLVAKLGPLAFEEDENHHWGGRVPAIGDWVMVNVGDAWGFDLPNDRRARIIDDVNVKAILQQPDVVW